MSGGTSSGTAELYATDRSRSAGQTEHMESAAKAGKCVFCDIDHMKNQILAKDGSHDPTGSAWKHWLAWVNPFPQEHQQHIMIIPKRHFSGLNFWEIKIAEWAELLLVIFWAVKFFKLKGGGFVFRFGDPARHAGSIPGHFHCQLQAPDGTGPVQATFYKDYHPAEQVRRKTEKAYTKKQFDGYIAYDAQGMILCFKDDKYLRWGKPNKPEDKIIFPKEALGDLYLTLKGWGEQLNMLQRATWSKDDQLQSENEPHQLKQKGGYELWEVFAFAAYKITDAAFVAYGEIEGYAYGYDAVNGDEKFFDSQLRPGDIPFYFHWHAARYVEEALRLRDHIAYKPAKEVYWRPGEEARPAGCDSLNWIDDSEDFDQLGIW